MSWMSALAETYDNCISAVGDQNYKRVLMPLYHIEATPHLTIVLDIEGNFLQAEEVPKNDKETTIIPATKKSSTSRTRESAPHALCDELKYLAGDGSNYFGTNYIKHHKDYMKQLKEWIDSEYSTEKVKAIFKYLSKNTVIKDLIGLNLLKVTADNKLVTNFRLSKKPESAEKTFIRFKVLKPEDRCYTSETWLDNKLFESYIGFSKSKKTEKNLCYITGEMTDIADNHPNGIRYKGDLPKLISSNDKSKYVGRFTKKEDAVTIGYEVSQKAHNALRWLIGNQGYENGNEVIVAWSVKGKKLPEVLEDADSPFGDVENSEEAVVDTGAIFAQRLNKAIAGYKQALDLDDKIVIMSVDVAAKKGRGRLSIKYYCELDGSVYFDNIKSWYEKCFWEIVSSEEKPARISVPIPREIAEAAYGRERKKVAKKKEIYLIEIDEQIQKYCIDRILPCIINGKPFPKDLVKLAVENVSRPMAFSDYNHKKLIAITCAIIKAYYKDSKGECITMNVSETNDRSYLFGRLLAVADVLEQKTFGKDEKNRTTNAKRYWSAFVKKPAKTWGIISERLLPYMDKQSKHMGYYNRLLEEIHSKFDPSDFNDQELNSKYVLGYWCQRKEMNTKKAEINKEEN